MIRNPIQVAVGVVINDKNEILVSLRLSTTEGELWEFPGGKLESGEESYQALCRELKEEVNIIVTEAKPLITIEHHYDDYMLMLYVWEVMKFEGEAMSMEGQLIRWIPLNEVKKLPFLKPNQAILDKLLK